MSCPRCGKDTMSDIFIYPTNFEGVCNSCFDDDVLYSNTGRRTISGKEYYMGKKPDYSNSKTIRLFGIPILTIE